MALSIEAKLGRKRSAPGYASRTIDIDILFYNDNIINTGELTVPHPRLHLRNFTLMPLNDVSPQLLHPVLGKTISELLLGCKDKHLALSLGND